MSKIQEDHWRWFLKTCLKFQSEKELNEFFDLVLTAEESNAVALRCGIIRELIKEEKTQREIAQALNISIGKITRGSNYLKRISSRLKMFLTKNVK